MTDKLNERLETASFEVLIEPIRQLTPRGHFCTEAPNAGVFGVSRCSSSCPSLSVALSGDPPGGLRRPPDRVTDRATDSDGQSDGQASFESLIELVRHAARGAFFIFFRVGKNTGKTLYKFTYSSV